MKKPVAGGIALATIGLSLLSFGAAYAHQANVGNNLASKFAERFNLDETEVQQFLDEQHATNEADREQAMSDHLQSLVDDGTLTTEQKTALETKLEAIRNERETLRNQDLTPQQRHDKMQSAREDLEAWANEQGIDLDVIHPQDEQGMPGHHGFRHMD
ncbi:hypothetical protein KC878_00210 [Candidatus Saccharibacteria bacterium]|nr:hypothetical protein [Candidatus Saccharibacteria bacterium]MCB9821038.1 hypothetical protein [Candidatus Nomurabacteria bacterium]